MSNPNPGDGYPAPAETNGYGQELQVAIGLVVRLITSRHRGLLGQTFGAESELAMTRLGASSQDVRAALAERVRENLDGLVHGEAAQLFENTLSSAEGLVGLSLTNGASPLNGLEAELDALEVAGDEKQETTGAAGDAELYEGTVLLNVEENIGIGRVVRFMRDLCFGFEPFIRMVKLVGSQEKDVVVLVALREPLDLKRIISQIDNVAGVWEVSDHEKQPHRALRVQLGSGAAAKNGSSAA